jgi:hypothetical protein
MGYINVKYVQPTRYGSRYRRKIPKDLIEAHNGKPWFLLQLGSKPGQILKNYSIAER